MIIHESPVVLLQANTVTDPSWFFSSLAQATAAIVGLLGAILLSQLLRHGDDMARSRSAIVERFIGQKMGARNLKSTAEQYGRFLRERTAALETALGQGKSTLSVYSMMTWNSNRSGGSPEEIAVDPKSIDQMKADARITREVSQALDELALSIHPEDSSRLSESFKDMSRNWPDVPKRWAQSFATELDAISASIQQHKARTMSRRVLLLLFILVWLSATGIVAPMTWLIVGPDSVFQIVLLGMVGLGLLGLFYYLAQSLLSIRSDSRLKLSDDEVKR